MGKNLFLLPAAVAVFLVVTLGSCNQSAKKEQAEKENLLKKVPAANENNSTTNTATDNTIPATEVAGGQLYLGTYACYGYGHGGQLMAGMGFVLLSNGTYHDVDGERAGSYTYNRVAATINFNGGFLDGQQGYKVDGKGFWLTETVFAEPWK